METKWSAQQVARLLGRSDLTVSRCWYQWTKKRSVTWQAGSGRPQHTKSCESRHIIRHASKVLTGSLSVIHT
ncbi:hypothetical protein TNCV_3786671 [Trichonephila clavipes]|nr:hypothetical protein TNCV_3786671 [Trichonephila clavipes]